MALDLFDAGDAEQQNALSGPETWVTFRSGHIAFGSSVE
jgi:hypothetical protein